MGGPIVSVLLIGVLGAGVYLRLVAKEKFRRERHLQYRLDEQLRKIQERKDLEQKPAEATQARAELGGIDRKTADGSGEADQEKDQAA